MIGTRAHGRSRVYRYYTCFTRVRYDTARCSAARLDADAVEHAVTTALAGFYRDQHDLIADAITREQASHAAAEGGWRAELTAAEHELARTSAAIDRYLTAFENGALDPEDLAGRLAQLTTRSAQLRARREQLASQAAASPAAPPAATLRQVADHIADIVAAGSHSQRKALIEALIHQIKITGPGLIVPVFRIPQPAAEKPDVSAGPATAHSVNAEDPVRAMTNLVVLWRQLSNATSQVKRALAAYRKLDLSEACPTPASRPVRRTVHRLTAREIGEAAEAYRTGATLREVGAQLGVDRKTVGRNLKARGIQLRRKAISPEEIQQAAQLYEQGFSIACIAEKLGYHGTTIHLRLKAAGVVMRDTHGRAVN